MPNLPNPELEYTIGSPSMIFQLPGTTNGNCQFTSSLVHSGTQPAGIGYTYTPPTLVFDSNSVDVYSITQSLSIMISTTNASTAVAGKLSLDLTISTTDVVPTTKKITIPVNIKEMCVSSGITLP